MGIFRCIPQDDTNERLEESLGGKIARLSHRRYAHHLNACINTLVEEESAGIIHVPSPPQTAKHVHELRKRLGLCLDARLCKVEETVSR